MFSNNVTDSGFGMQFCLSSASPTGPVKCKSVGALYSKVPADCRVRASEVLTKLRSDSVFVRGLSEKAYKNTEIRALVGIRKSQGLPDLLVLVVFFRKPSGGIYEARLLTLCEDNTICPIPANQLRGGKYDA